MPALQKAAMLRDELESKLSTRVPGAFSMPTRTAPIRISSGNAAVDELLRGGMPVGMITELAGPECSGRTTIALSLVAQLTASNSVCAWIDAADMLDPESAAACGVEVERLLWVRCGSVDRPHVAAAPAAKPDSGLSVEPCTPAGVPVRSGGSPHPRTEGRGMPQALSAMMRSPLGAAAIPPKRRDLRRIVGTPGAPNRPLGSSAYREEQVNSDRLPPRRGDNLTLAPRCAEAQRSVRPEPYAGSSNTSAPKPSTAKPSAAHKPLPGTWQAVDQALRAVDLVLQGGGFSLIVLDLGSTTQELVWRIPMATWFRFRAACERTRVSLLVLTQFACTRSSAELVVQLNAGRMVSRGGVMQGIAFQGAAERSRSQQSAQNIQPGMPAASKVVNIRKPPQRVQDAQPGSWSTEAAWIRHG